MAYEMINVRMSRSNQSIQWGFSLRQGSGSDIVIANVERESMAEKAGLCTNDIITDIMGFRGLSLNESNQKIAAAFEINMNLKRWVTSHPALPWTLNEQDNKIVVDTIGSSGLRPLHTQSSDGFVNSFSSTMQSGQPVAQQKEYSSSNYERNYQESRTKSTTSPGAGFPRTQIAPPAPLIQQTSPSFKSQISPALNPKGNTMSTHSHSSWDAQEGNVKKHFESSKSYEKSESSSTTQFDRPFGAPGAFTTSGSAGFGSGPAGFTSGGAGGAGGFGSTGFGSGGNAGFGSGFTSGGGSGGPGGFGKTGFASDDKFRHNGINEQLTTQIPPPPPAPRATSMQHSPAAFSPRGRQDQQRPLTASPYSGPRQYYQHNPRTVRELSPTATVQHLQYNSPMGLYSKESAAEAYRQQTGGLFGTDPNINRSNEPPAYLSSETRRLIAENESGLQRSCSPSTQSASFKRIANACGTPVN